MDEWIKRKETHNTFFLIQPFNLMAELKRMKSKNYKTTYAFILQLSMPNSRNLSWRYIMKINSSMPRIITKMIWVL